jgi:hypothetical protein
MMRLAYMKMMMHMVGLNKLNVLVAQQEDHYVGIHEDDGAEG